MRLSNIALSLSAIYGGSFDPLSLFSAGEQGVWYDPSDLTTLFQDSAGTTPVTAVEQPVGLMLDKSKGLVLGSEAVVNGDFSGGTTSWSSTPTYPSTAAVSSGAFQVTATGDYGSQFQNLSLTVGKTYLITGTARSITGGGKIANVGLGTSTGATFVVVKSTSNTTATAFSFVYTHLNSNYSYLILGNGQTGAGPVAEFDNISVKELPGNHAYQSTSAARPLLSARVNLLTATNVLSTQSVTTVATTYTLFFSGTGAITLTGTATGVYTAGTYTITCTAGTLIATVAGLVTQADLRVANDGVGIPSYQRVNTSTDYDTTGFPLYIKPNGSSQFMVTNSIDFSATDKMTVWAGVRKLSDASTAMLLETSTAAEANNGAFNFIPRNLPSLTLQAVSRGTVAAVDAATTNSAYAAPVSLVVSTAYNIAGPSIVIRANTVQAVSNTSAQGTGNYGNYPLYLFARAGSSLWLNGRMYNLIIRGAASTAGQISQTETYVNSKTKAWG